MNTHHDGTTKSINTEAAYDDDFEFFPREASGSGLLEEIVHKFLPKSKPNKDDSITTTTTTTLPELPPQPVSHPMFVSNTQCYYNHNDNSTDQSFDVSFDRQGFLPQLQQQLDILNGFNSVQDMPFGNDQWMMDDAEISITQDIARYQEFFNTFAANIQNV